MGDFDIEKIIEIGFGIIIVIFIFLIAIYIVQGIVLNKLNKKIYGKGTALAWIPLCNNYLLGKLTVNKTFGIIFLLLPLLNSKFTITSGRHETIYTIIPLAYKGIYILVYSILFIVLFIYAIVKLNKLGKGEETYINEVYLNQKTKQEIMEEDEQVKLVKWDENEEQGNTANELKQEENNIPFQSFVNTNEKFEEPKQDLIEEQKNTNLVDISTEDSLNNNTGETVILDNLENTEELDIIKENNNNLVLANQEDIDEEYDYDNPKIQEAIDNIINKEIE